MSATKLPPDVVQARRQLAREAERTCRLLREYAHKLHRITDRLYSLGSLKAARSGALFSFGRSGVAEDELGAALAATLLSRRAVIAGMVEVTCRVASGMVEAGALPLGVKSELLLRLRETESALDEARRAAKFIHHSGSFAISELQLADDPVPDLVAIERQRREAREAVPQPAD